MDLKKWKTYNKQLEKPQITFYQLRYFEGNAKDQKSHENLCIFNMLFKNQLTKVGRN